MKSISKQITSHLVPVTILLITIFSVLPYLKNGVPMADSLNNTTLIWGVSLLILGVFIFSWYYFFDRRNRDTTLIIWMYLFWNGVCIIRGMFEADIYWDWKGLIANSMALAMPIVVFSTTNKMIVRSLLASYVKYALPLFLMFAFLLRTDSFGMYLMPVTLLVLFYPSLSKRQKIVLLAATMAVIMADLGARSHILKFSIPFLILVLFVLKRWITTKMLEAIRISLFLIPLLFFVLGVTGLFNLFRIQEYLDKEYSVTATSLEGNPEEQSVTADTRTFIYYEVLTSAIHNNYWLLGRTPARGNDSDTFGIYNYELTGRNERLSNEVGLANVFTWTGILGVILYLLIFFRASWLAVNRSNNIYLRMLGVFVAFRWLFSWVEDVNNFTINYFMVMMAIGMCFSHSFRKMSESEFSVWARSIFDVRYVHFQTYLIKKEKREKYETNMSLHSNTEVE